MLLRVLKYYNPYFIFFVSFSHQHTFKQKHDFKLTPPYGT